MEILITSVLAFIATNIDDIFILTLFYGNRKFKHSEIVAGQYLGIIALIAVSLIGAIAGLLIDAAYIGLLGLVPVYLGLKEILELIQHKEGNHEATIEVSRKRKSNVLSVAGVTFANGGDNIGIYIPLFATITWSNKITMVMVFLTMTFFWCLAARYLAKHPYVAKTVEKYGHIVTPFVLVLLGLYILYESGTFELLKM